jgi:hypothetical protein
MNFLENELSEKRSFWEPSIWEPGQLTLPSCESKDNVRLRTFVLRPMGYGGRRSEVPWCRNCFGSDAIAQNNHR